MRRSLLLVVLSGVSCSLLGMALEVLRYDQERDLAAVQKIADQGRQGLNGGRHFDVRVGLLFGKTYVARDDKKILGFINYSTQNNRLMGEIYGSIDLLAVAKKARGKSVGRKLLVHALQDIEQQGYYRIILSVYKANHNAIHLYESLGFLPTEVPIAEYGRMMEMSRQNSAIKEQQKNLCRQRAQQLSERCCGCFYPAIYSVHRWLSGLY